MVWSERVPAIGNPELLTHHAGWVLTARYSQHMSSMLQEATTSGTHLRLRLEEYAGQVKAENHVVKDTQKGNRELLQKNAHLETRVRELNNELMRTYRSITSTSVSRSSGLPAHLSVSTSEQHLRFYLLLRLWLPGPLIAGATSDHTCFNYGRSGHFA
jgi:hypothetical protein